MLQLQSGVYAVAGLASRLFIPERKTMSLQAPFFGKRPADPITPRSTPSQPERLSGSSSAGLATATTVAPVTSVTALAPAAQTVALASHTPAPAPSGAPLKEGGSQLTVGPGIKLKGVEITDCDTLVVEGMVEATMDSRVMHITEIGAFKGSADVDYAEIHGAFSGDLTVREKLVIYATGRVNGKICYGKLVIQEGGQLLGDIQFGAGHKTQALAPAKMGLVTTA